MTDSWQTILLVLNADSPPDVILFRGKAKASGQQLLESLRSLRQNLKRVPLGRHHYAANSFDVVVRNTFLEKVAHGIHKHELRRPPGKRLGQLLRNQAQVEPLLVRMTFDPAKPLRKRFGVAVLAAGTDLGAAAHGVPGCISPFDVGVE